MVHQCLHYQIPFQFPEELHSPRPLQFLELIYLLCLRECALFHLLLQLPQSFDPLLTVECESPAVEFIEMREGIKSEVHSTDELSLLLCLLNVHIHEQEIHEEVYNISRKSCKGLCLLEAHIAFSELF